MIITVAFIVNLIRALYLMTMQVYRVARKKFLLKKRVVKIGNADQEGSSSN